jgi:hypothetical protein
VQIPGWMLRHRVIVEPYLGQSASGPRYGPAVPVRCFIDDARRLVRNEAGVQVVSESTVYCRLDVTAPPKSRVNVFGREAFVITAKRRDSAGLPTPDHLELVLT